MLIAFYDGSLLLDDAPNAVPHAEWNNRVESTEAVHLNIDIIYRILDR